MAPGHLSLSCMVHQKVCLRTPVYSYINACECDNKPTYTPNPGSLSPLPLVSDLPALCLARYLSRYCFFLRPNHVHDACCSFFARSMARQATLLRKFKQHQWQLKKRLNTGHSCKVNIYFCYKIADLFRIPVNPFLSAPLSLPRLGQLYLKNSYYISQGSKHVYSSQWRGYACCLWDCTGQNRWYFMPSHRRHMTLKSVNVVASGLKHKPLPNSHSLANLLILWLPSHPTIRTILGMESVLQLPEWLT